MDFTNYGEVDNHTPYGFPCPETGISRRYKTSGSNIVGRDGKAEGS